MDKVAELKLKAEADYQNIVKLGKMVNGQAKVSRNAMCQCGSRKKWKKCCMPHFHNARKKLEAMIADYRCLCAEIRNLDRESAKRKVSVKDADGNELAIKKVDGHVVELEEAHEGPLAIGVEYTKEEP